MSLISQSVSDMLNATRNVEFIKPTDALVADLFYTRCDGVCATPENEVPNGYRTLSKG